MIKFEDGQIISVDKGRLFRLISSYDHYPDFVRGVKSVHVQRKEPGRARVTYTVSIVKDLVTTVDLAEDESRGTVSWRLVWSDAFKINNGFWYVKNLGSGKSEVRYGVELDFKVPVPGFILKRLVKVILPSIIEAFEKRAREL